MPTTISIALDVLQQNAIQHWMQQRNINPNASCAGCNGVAWEFADIIGVNAAMQAGFAISGQQNRMLRRRCTACGFISLFDAAVVGV